ncbi:MAG: type II toxin-antitoxin system VapC family toxin [Verrucomicrobiota bacterium]
MIFVDANILLYAEDSLSKPHDRARDWWDEQLSGTAPVCLCWTVLNAFIRIGTNRRVFERPLSLEEAAARVESWLRQPCTRIVVPTERHWTVFAEMLWMGKATANLVTDAHLAALAIEHGCVLHSTDTDFARFPALKWRNPLQDR